MTHDGLGIRPIRRKLIKVSLRTENPSSEDEGSAGEPESPASEPEPSGPAPRDAAMEEMARQVEDIDIKDAPASVPKERETIPLSTVINFSHDREVRLRWMGFAQKANQRKELSSEDVFLINLFVAGDKWVFRENTFKAMWEAINDEQTLNMVNDHPVDSYARRALDRAYRANKETQGSEVGYCTVAVRLLYSSQGMVWLLSKLCRSHGSKRHYHACRHYRRQDIMQSQKGRRLDQARSRRRQEL